MIKSLYEDSDILVVIKPAGMESQTARRLEPDMVSEIIFGYPQRYPQKHPQRRKKTVENLTWELSTGWTSLSVESWYMPRRKGRHSP